MGFICCFLLILNFNLSQLGDFLYSSASQHNNNNWKWFQFKIDCYSSTCLPRFFNHNTDNHNRQGWLNCSYNIPLGSWRVDIFLHSFKITPSKQSAIRCINRTIEALRNRLCLREIHIESQKCIMHFHTQVFNPMFTQLRISSVQKNAILIKCGDLFDSGLGIGTIFMQVLVVSRIVWLSFALTLFRGFRAFSS